MGEACGITFREVAQYRKNTHYYRDISFLQPFYGCIKCRIYRITLATPQETVHHVSLTKIK